jgi:hypothetical protein
VHEGVTVVVLDGVHRLEGVVLRDHAAEGLPLPAHRETLADLGETGPLSQAGRGPGRGGGGSRGSEGTQHTP